MQFTVHSSGARLSVGSRQPQKSANCATFKPSRSVRASVAAPIQSLGAVVDDKTVPEGHKGLHNFLYGDHGAEEEHDRSVGSYTVRKDEDEGSMVMPVAAYLDSRDGEKPLGVYCVYDAAGAPQYVGYSRNMVLAIKGHLARVGAERCAAVRAMVYRNRAMSSRANLEAGVADWVARLPELAGVAPPGNADEAQRAEWEGTRAGAAAEEGAAGGPALETAHMSAAELAAYEDKKLKMRKAMGEKNIDLPGAAGQAEAAHAHEEEEVDDPATRREKLMKAMNRGDWSAVIAKQTEETLEGEAAEAAASAAEASASGASSDGGASASAASTSGDTIVSPFAAGGSAGSSSSNAGGGSGGSGAREWPPMTPAAVQAALEEVRPYLLADGGDVEVVEVKEGVVFLSLQGACSSCPSQSATMKGGIERVIHKTFGDQVRDIVQVGSVDPGANAERVDASLNMLRGAIYNFGGSVEVISVEDGICTLRYKGPAAIGKGVQGAVKDSFKDLKEVVLVTE